MLSHEILPKLCPQYPLSAVMLPLMQSSVCVCVCVCVCVVCVCVCGVWVEGRGVTCTLRSLFVNFRTLHTASSVRTK